MNESSSLESSVSDKAQIEKEPLTEMQESVTEKSKCQKVHVPKKTGMQVRSVTKSSPN